MLRKVEETIEGTIIRNENGFEIMLKKPNDNNKYILEADPTIIE